MSVILNGTTGVDAPSINVTDVNALGNAAITGSVTAASFSGAGTGLTGTAPSLTVLTSTNTTNLSGGSVAATSVSNASPFYYNGRNVSANVTIGGTENVLSAGPIVIADGVTVTITAGGEWVIV